MRRASPIVCLALLLIGVVAFLYLQSGSRLDNAHSQVRTATHALAANAYLYYTLKNQNGFVLARAQKGSSGQPLSNPQPIASFGNSFGLSEADSVASMQLSPDAAYLAIDGISDHGELVWLYDTQRMTMTLQPPHVMGNFLHWLPQGHTFLYRPMFPLGPGAPMDGNQWNPGLWLVDAATGNHQNIDIHMSSANLIDATASPDGSRIIYSTSLGLGQGGDVWFINKDGSNLVHLLSTAAGAQSIPGFFTWSPDGTHIAYERLSDSSTPFLTAGLWLMDSNGGHQSRLADTDGGHGYAPAWSPDGSKIAFVVRTNTADRHADQLAQSLQSAISVASISTHRSWVVVSAQQTNMQLNTNPVWSDDSNSITFTALNPTNRVLGGTPRYWSARVSNTQAQPAVVPLTPALSQVVATN